MKPLATTFLIALAALPLVRAAEPLPILTSPLLLSTDGSFMEVQESDYVRMSTVTKMKGQVIIERLVDGEPTEPCYFQMSSQGLERLEALKKRLIREGKFTDLVGRIEVVIDDQAYVVFDSGKRNPLEDFDRFTKSVYAARGQLIRVVKLVNGRPGQWVD